MFASTFFAIINEDRNCLFIRDFGQLLDGIHSDLQHLTVKISTSNSCIWSLIKHAYKKIYSLKTHRHTQTHTNYIYIYIHKLNPELALFSKVSPHKLLRESSTDDLIFVIGSTLYWALSVIVALQHFTVGFLFLLTNWVHISWFFSTGVTKLAFSFFFFFCPMIFFLFPPGGNSRYYYL